MLLVGSHPVQLLSLSWARDDSGHLEAGGYSCLISGEIENVLEHNSQLVCTCSEGMARDAVWAGSLGRVNTFEELTYCTSSVENVSV